MRQCKYLSFDTRMLVGYVENRRDVNMYFVNYCEIVHMGTDVIYK
jgi:hypothetical protein